MKQSCLLHHGSGLWKPTRFDKRKIHDAELAGDNCCVKKITSLQFLITEMTFWLQSIFIYAFSVFIKEWKCLGIVWLLNDFLNARKTNSKIFYRNEAYFFSYFWHYFFCLKESYTAPQRLMKLYVNLFSRQLRHSPSKCFLPTTAIYALLQKNQGLPTQKLPSFPTYTALSELRTKDIWKSVLKRKSRLFHFCLCLQSRKNNQQPWNCTRGDDSKQTPTLSGPYRS